MATIHDVMPAFELFQPTSIDDALSLLERHRRSVWVLAGGLDTFDWLKDRNKRPSVVIDLSGVEALRGIKALPDGGLEIGATTTLTEIANHSVVKEKFGLLAESAGLVASPQIRNQGTLGGNVSQDTRCWYYRSGWTCYRAGGNICYADTPTSINREHALFDANRCVAVNPSDTAPALVALDAQMVIRNSGGERVVPAEEFFIGPSVDITRMTVMEPGDLLDLDPHSGHVGGREVLLREGSRSPGVGLPARQRRVGAEDFRRQYSAGANRGERGRGAPDAAACGRSRGHRQGAKRSDSDDGGRTGGPGQPAAGAQRLQDSLDA